MKVDERLGGKRRTSRLDTSTVESLRRLRFARCTAVVAIWCAVCSSIAWSQQTLDEARAEGRERSSYRHQEVASEPPASPQADLQGFRKSVEPLLRDACYGCHGSDLQEGEFRVDTLDPDMIQGKDASWWLEVFRAVSNGEMPPEGDGDLAPAAKQAIIRWLSKELHLASQVARSEGGHSSFRRLTRYEYNYALQDLLGLPFDFAKDLPPESPSADGFLNSSDMLQVSARQLEIYREIAHQALEKALVRGDRPDPVYYSVTMDFGIEREQARFESDLDKLRKRFADQPERLEAELQKRKRRRPRGAYYLDRETGFSVAARWGYSGARYARTPTAVRPETPETLRHVAVIPKGQQLIVDLGDHLPASGNLRLRMRASAIADRETAPALLQVYFGHQASNNSRADEAVGKLAIPSGNEPQFVELLIPLSEVVRNPFRGTQKLGQTPNPAEYLMFRNASDTAVEVHTDYMEIVAPYNQQWPPASHQRILGEDLTGDEQRSAEAALTRMMTRAWRRPPTSSELAQKMTLYARLRPQCEDAQETLQEVLSGVLASPKFLYLVQHKDGGDDYELATRLAMFLWSSVPDDRLLDLAGSGTLSQPATLREQTRRMLHDPKSSRFTQHFVRQWLGMQLLDHHKIDEDLREAMAGEPIAMFAHVLNGNRSIMDFLHADYLIVNGRLAQHYGVPNVYGVEYQRAPLPATLPRGGLLTQAGLLAMNSDGMDSHPLKRGIWLLENMLNDPPPPPPPAVPEIDLTDPNILKLTLKERMEDHRNDPACSGCHQRIDPWGIAFENYDALGRWRDTVQGKPVDANSVLFNSHELQGVLGLKRYLLKNRQDQFARSMTHKLTAYALGRPLSFADRAEVDRITAELRRQGDGLGTLIDLIVASELFHGDTRE